MGSTEYNYCTVLYCTVLYCTVLYCTVLYCTVLYCTVLYCTVLYCTVLSTILKLILFFNHLYITGRNVQRERSNSEVSIKKVTSDTNSMKYHHLLQVDLELEMARSAHDLKIIEIAMKNADNDSKKVI